MSAIISSLQTRQDPNLYSNCTFAICDMSTSYWTYRPSLPANAALLSLFTLSLLHLLLMQLLTRRFTAFNVAFIFGCTLEILGYVGRIFAHLNPWHESAFLLQIICLTIAPAFMAAGIYLCLRKIVYIFGKENSRIEPETYTRFFIPCDVLSLILQALGGGMASTASHEGRSSKLGDYVMVAGLAFQVLTLIIFMGLSLDFATRTVRRHRQAGDLALDPKFSQLRSSRMFKGFLSALVLSTLCIFTRSVYRVAELSEGWEGYLIKQQWMFFGLEGIMVTVAVGILNIFHPAMSFKEEEEGLGGLRSLWRCGGFRSTKN